MRDEDGRIEIEKREPLYEGFYRLERYTVRHQRFDGRWSDDLCREVLIQSPGVGILPYDPQQDAIVLTEQFRLPAKLAGFPAWQLEIPAGMVEEGEDAQQV